MLMVCDKILVGLTNFHFLFILNTKNAIAFYAISRSSYDSNVFISPGDYFVSQDHMFLVKSKSVKQFLTRYSLCFPYLD